MKRKVFAFALMFVFVFAMCACSNTETAEVPDISGEYQDEVSQRATLKLVKHEDGNTYDAVIGWSSSASELVEWAFTGDFDGEKIEYTDGISKLYTSDEDGNANEELRDGDYSGTLLLSDGKLKWTGSNDGETGLFALVTDENEE